MALGNSCFIRLYAVSSRQLFQQFPESSDRLANAEKLERGPQIGGDVGQHRRVQIALQRRDRLQAIPSDRKSVV